MRSKQSGAYGVPDEASTCSRGNRLSEQSNALRIVLENHVLRVVNDLSRKTWMLFDGMNL